MKKGPKTCSQGICLQSPAKGGLCYYHAKVTNGQIDPAEPKRYPVKIIETAHQREMARLKQQVFG